MKIKNVVFILFSGLMLTFAACTKTEYVDSGPTENPNQSYAVTLTPGNWIRVSPALIEYDIPLQALTDYYILQGGVAVALSFDPGEKIYDVLPSTFDGLAYSVRYEEGFVVIAVDDPLSDDAIDVTIPTGNIMAKIILTKTSFNDYNGFFNSPLNEFEFKSLD